MDHDQLRQWSKRATKHSADRPRDDRGGPRQRPQHGGVAAAKRLALGLVLIPLPLLAEPWPAAQSPYVNDYAAVIEDAAEARIVTALTDLRAQTGIEATVLTLPTRQGYTPAPDIDTFATGLFNVWGIGDATRNDGILILVLTEDRDMRIALGAGYNPEYDIPAQDIINAVMLPAFRDGRYSQGIESGTREVVNRIARRHAGLDPVALPEAAGGLRAGAPRASGEPCQPCPASLVSEQAFSYGRME
ncbi:TPM domain-containing protein [Phaeovulum veldkampii]|uniref:TPM domain-containing protein n=1 Tax=Phaeovulum veldkampii TaxID=33049 RepID=UPI0019117F48|nr:TPM domain-containing protein [Phaeovulum veldkampii]